MIDRAQQALHLLAFDPVVETTADKASLAATYSAWGKLEAARSVHAELLARSLREYVSPFLLAVSASANRQPDEAMQFARRAYEIRDPQLIVFGKHWIGTKGLVEDPRFAELLASIGLQ